jgi:hypothetical protein
MSPPKMARGDIRRRKRFRLTPRFRAVASAKQAFDAPGDRQPADG